MLKLHGTPISNFYCIAKQALREKNIAVEEVHVMAKQEPAFLAMSPMGKIPALETEHGYLSETDVILEYIEERYPTPPLYPQETFARAKIKQLIKVIELYVETPAHQLVPWLLGGAPLPEHIREQAKPALERGLAALGRLAQFTPWAGGAEFTAADIFLYRSISMVEIMAKTFYDWDALANVPGLNDWYARMAQRPSSQAVNLEADAARQAFREKTGREIGRL